MTDEKNMEKAQKSLGEYKVRIERFLEKYLDEKISALQKVDYLGGEAGKYLKDFILPKKMSGKRLRAAFTYYGYRAAGGGDGNSILYASAGMEILHNFFLVHDDIIDKSETRHNEPTINKRFEIAYEKRGLITGFSNEEKSHIASSMAIIVGDICCALAYEALIDSGFEHDKIIKGLKMMHDVIKVTAIGEVLDIYKPVEYKPVENKPVEKWATEDEIRQIHLLKTAKYTFECPLQLGAILQGTSPEFLDSLSEYAIPVGIAFQIRDDILGIFGEEKKLGKPVGSDIREGKQTLLLTKALEKASPAQRKRITGLVGKSTVTRADMQDVQEIMRETGSLKYSEDKTESLTEKGKMALDKLALPGDIKDILLGLADSMKVRNI